MASNDKQFSELSKSVNEVSKSVAVIENTLGLGKWIASTACIVSLGALGWCWHLGNKVTAIEQQLADGGNTKLVAELKEPKSLQQLQANLTTVSAQIQTARLEQKQPDLQKLHVLSDAVTQVVKNNSELPQAWSTAIQLVDYKFQGARTSSLPNCLTLELHTLHLATYPDGSPRELPSGTHIPNVPVVAEFQVQNCELDLTDKGDFGSTAVGQAFKDAKTHDPRISRLVLDVSNAHIVYSGGKMLPITAISFMNCSFDVTPSIEVPDRGKRDITTQLLAVDSTKGRIELLAGL